MLLDELRKRKEEIEKLSRDFGVRRIRVFGSVARREEMDGSDIDFLVDLPKGYDLFKQRLPLAEQLAKLTGRHVELIPEHELNRHIKNSVLQEAIDL
jgi:predicted nucleotidyltransferase